MSLWKAEAEEVSTDSEFGRDYTVRLKVMSLLGYVLNTIFREIRSPLLFQEKGLGDEFLRHCGCNRLEQGNTE